MRFPGVSAACAATVLFLLSGPVFAQGAVSSGRATVNVADLQAGTAIVGRSGFELGKVVSIGCKVMDSGRLEYDSVLQVTSVDRHPLNAPVELPFEIAAGSSVSAVQLQRGKLLSLRVYETGGMVGVPEQAQKELQIVQTPSWQFRTSIIILASEPQ